MVLPEGEIATELTGPVWPTKRKGLTFGLKFQTMTVLSRDPLITWLKLGLKHVERIPSLWPLNERVKAGSACVPA